MEYPDRKEIIEILTRNKIKFSKKEDTNRLKKKYEKWYNEVQEKIIYRQELAVERNSRRNARSKEERAKRKAMSLVGANDIPRYKAKKRLTRRERKQARNG